MGPSLTVDGVRELADALVTPELVVVPVRHHSPACAWHVRRMMAEHRPSVVLVEGPRSFTPLVPLLTHPQARMPLAVYTYAVRRGDRWSAYYPFCDYSPELVALREASAAGIPARFVDLDLAEQVLTTRTDHGRLAAQALLDERHYERSRRLQGLAERIGCRDHEDLWEHLFEADPRAVAPAEHLARVLAYCLLARQDTTSEELDAEGTTAREAEMAWHVRDALAARRADDGPVLVVLGGFHAVALRELLADPPPRPSVPLTGVTADHALIRYSFDRLERLNGYASGMTSPGWHQHVWTLLADPTVTEPRTTATLTALMDVVAELRRRGLPLPLPTVQHAFEAALRLAELRDRPGPLRSDLVDAVTGSFVQGDADVEGLLVRAATRTVLTGRAVGTVPPGTGTPPLVSDALERLRRARLSVDGAERLTAALDLYRRPAHRATSRLLHGLSLLGVPFAVRVAGPDFVHGHGLERLQERWEYRWSPAAEGALVEASVHGATLTEAVASRFAERLAAQREAGARRDAAMATGLLAQACVLGLHEEATAALALAREALASDVAFDALATATVQLALLLESREPLEAARLTTLPDVLQAAYRRTVYLGRELTGQECEPVAAVGALVRLRELLVSGPGEALDADLYWAMVERTAERHDVPLVRGGATGLLHAARRGAPGDLARAVAGHLGGSTSSADAVGFLRGLLTTAREAAWQEVAVLHSLDARLAEWDADAFLAHLPELRLAFAALTPAETDRVAHAVAGLHGRPDLGELVQRSVDEAQLHHHLAVSRRAAALLAADGLDERASS